MRLSTSNFAHVLKTKIKQNIVSKVLHFLELSQLRLRALTAVSKTLIKCILVVQVGQSQTEDYHRQKSGATFLNLGKQRKWKLCDLISVTSPPNKQGRHGKRLERIMGGKGTRKKPLPSIQCFHQFCFNPDPIPLKLGPGDKDGHERIGMGWLGWGWL